MKILDRYVLKSFFTPFLAAFFVVLFVLVMQAVWLAFDDIAGKGIDVSFVLKFLAYLSLMLVPTALPIAILLSSIMSLGNLSENYEFAAIKSAGISLKRTILPLVIVAFVLSIFNYIFLNNVYPWASFKQKNLYYNIKKKKPALAFVPGQFNTEIPGYSIKFDEKYGAEKNFLKNVQISDLTDGKGKVKVITAQKGEITSEENSKYLTFTLYDGNYYEEHWANSYKKRQRMPASKGVFQKYIINIDVSDLDNNNNLDEENIKEHYSMLTIKQLRNISKERKEKYDDYIKYKADFLQNLIKSYRLRYYPTTPSIESLESNILQNFDYLNQRAVIDQSIDILSRATQKNDTEKQTFKDRRKWLNLFDFEASNRISFALACLVLFFIGAPLGSIIRKGGFGFPMVTAIIIFVAYYFLSQFSRKLAEESAVTSFVGSWISNLTLLPLGIYLTHKATKGKAFTGFSAFTEKITSLFKRKNKENES